MIYVNYNPSNTLGIVDFSMKVINQYKMEVANTLTYV